MITKSLDIRYFSSADNSLPEEKKTKEAKAKKVVLTGYISVSGKLVFPVKTVNNLDVDLEKTAFKVGMQEGKRKAKSLYLISANSGQEDTFQFKKAAKSYTLLLPLILKKSGVDFAKSKYVFIIHQFDLEGATALELQLSSENAASKPPYTGKPRGRKAKAIE